MDTRLVAWARAVKARRRAPAPPPLWLFTDPDAMPDLHGVIARLPRGLCGVLLRHDHVPDRPALARAVARQCRAAGIPLVVAGDPGLAWSLRAGMHLRGGRRSGRIAGPGWTTSSAHGAADLVRARRSRAAVAFLSPMFPTASHPGAPCLGAVRWAGLARRFGGLAFALGGVTGRTVRAIPPRAAGAGAIGAMLD